MHLMSNSNGCKCAAEARDAGDYAGYIGGTYYAGAAFGSLLWGVFSGGTCACACAG